MSVVTVRWPYGLAPGQHRPHDLRHSFLKVALTHLPTDTAWLHTRSLKRSLHDAISGQSDGGTGTTTLGMARMISCDARRQHLYCSGDGACRRRSATRNAAYVAQSITGVSDFDFPSKFACFHRLLGRQVDLDTRRKPEAEEFIHETQWYTLCTFIDIIVRKGPRYQ